MSLLHGITFLFKLFIKLAADIDNLSKGKVISSGHEELCAKQKENERNKCRRDLFYRRKTDRSVVRLGAQTIVSTYEFLSLF